MADKFEMLEVVDENDNVVGLETRDKIHQEGLRHREVHVFFITPKGEIIFQHRSKNKSSYPDKLDVTVGGHVSPGISYEEAALKECKEETGIDVKFKDLILLGKLKYYYIEGNIINDSIRSEYAHLYSGSVNDLKVEKGEVLGFEPWKIEDLPNLSEEDKEKFIPNIFSKEYLLMFKKAKEILIK